MKVQRPALGIVGSIMPLAALSVIVLLSLVGLSFTILGMGAANQLAVANVNLLSLGAMEAYMAFDCGDRKGEVEYCHSLKHQSAMARVTALVQEGENYGVTEVQSGEVGPESASFLVAGTAMVTPGRVETQAGTTAGTPGEIAFTVRNEGEYANAYHVRGVVSSPFMEALGFTAVADAVLPSFNTQAVAVANPIMAVALYDRSASTAEMTHASLSGGTSNCSPPAVSPDKFGQYPRIGGSSLYAYDYDDKNGVVVDAAAQCAWNRLPSDPPNNVHRDELPKNSHLKSDFILVNTVGSSTDAYDTYSQQLTDAINAGTGAELTNTPVFPAPGSAPSVSFEGAETEVNGVDAVFLDAYRDSQNLGPQPFTSIVQGLKAIAELQSARSVTGDKFGIVGFGETVTWNSVLNLGPTERVVRFLGSIPLGERNLVDFFAQPPQAASEGASSARELTGQPLFVSLGFFPRYTFTNTINGLSEANAQLATIGHQVPAGEIAPAAIPATQTIIALSDFATNCSPASENEPNGATVCDADSYERYAVAARLLNRFAEQQLFRKGIIFSAIHFGEIGGPHLLRRPSQDRPGQCMTAEEARARGIALTKGVSLGVEVNPDQLRQYKESRFLAARQDPVANPFYDIAADVERLARLTGGEYIPILAQNTGCSSGQLPASLRGCSESTQDLRLEASCFSPEVQIQNALKEAYARAQAYTIICSGSRCNPLFAASGLEF